MINSDLISSFEKKYENEDNTLLENTVTTNKPENIFKNRDIY